MNLVKAVTLITMILCQSVLAGGAQVVKLSVEDVSPQAKFKALETFYGDVIPVGQMIKVQRPLNIGQVLNSSVIETKDGAIYYPEEVEFVIKSASGRGLLEKAPHTPD